MSDGRTSDPDALFLGVDGGGSKTLAVLVDADGAERGRGLAGGSNYHVVGLDAAVTAIQAAVATARNMARRREPLAAAWVGLAGVDRAADANLLAPRLDTLAGALRLTNDAELALSGLPRGVGVALIAGTGSIALGRGADGRFARTSGWGHLMGDEGSGYDIGQRALRAAARAADGRGQPTLLLDRILGAWRLSAPEDLFTSVYGDPDKARLARLANLVIACAGEGDVVARAIIDDAADELALAVRTVAARLHLPSPVDLALGGGLLAHETTFRELVLARIRRELAIAAVTLVEEPAAQAARWLAQHSAPMPPTGESDPARD